MTDEAWAFAQKWVDENSRKICGYVSKHGLLKYSAYEMQDFLSEAYLVAYDAFISCGDKPFEAYFWIKYKNSCKSLANNPHITLFTGNVERIRAGEDATSYDEAIIERYLAILTPKQREAFSHAPLDISRQALQQRINSAIKAIQILRQSLYP